MERTFLVAAGGTGGHLFPGIAVADELRRRDPGARILFVGTPRGLESRLVPSAGYPLALLPILPLNRVGLRRLALGLLTLPWALLRAGALVLRERPRSVLGVGGYAGGPLVLVAALLGVRTVILEPNARPGFTNRVLRPFVTRAACAYDETLEWFGAKGILTGNPVRAELTAVPSRPPGSPLGLLAVGGSQGSRALNRALVEALHELPGSDQLAIVHQTGESMREEIAAAYAAAGRPARVVAFLDDMAGALAKADLVLARSGATTCAELAAAGKPAILVPFAAAADDHQRLNARAMETWGAARVLEEAELSGASLGATIRELSADPARLAEMGRSARSHARPDAAARVADLMQRAA
jgi:UDP-N-acetylglucosamine--N-acetylmuramyl-(pentapeptide) pyrophosphoryl-undecaprenol N-acetylglucosamine transferase